MIIMNSVYLLLGTNIGNRLVYLEKAHAAINASIGRIVNSSHVYESASWGYTSANSFLNQVVEIKTSLNHRELLIEVSRIEKKIGRIKLSKTYEDRCIDIDILFFNNNIIEEADLSIPHKQIANRRFTLLPLFEIAPDFEHPILNKNIRDLLDVCNDDINVTIYQELKQTTL